MKKFLGVLIAVGMVLVAAYIAIVFHPHTGCFRPIDQCVEVASWLP